MKFAQVRLKKNLRKSLLQGSPWLYKEALDSLPDVRQSILCKVADQKNKFVGWGFYSPNSVLAVRVISVENSVPDQDFYDKKMAESFAKRNHINREATNCYRLFNGEGDFLPGLVCDVYKDIGVLQFDGDGPYEFWDSDRISSWILENTECRTVYYKPRHDSKNSPQHWGEKIENQKVEVIENHCKFLVDFEKGQKTGFFLDQRDNRNYVRSLSNSKDVLNLFSYTGGFSIYAGMGGANTVKSIDLSREALDLSEENWKINGLNTEKHFTQAADVFEFLYENHDNYDLVICDPPSLAKAEKHKEAAMKKYIEAFSQSIKMVRPGGHALLSSCSSHIGFNDFNEIVIQAVSKARRRGQVLRFSGQGEDHPYPLACPQLRYLKFMDVIVN